MNKSLFAALILSFALSAGFAQAAELGVPTTILTCRPTAADANRSGLESVVVTRHAWGCNQNGAGPHCFAMGVYYSAEVKVEVAPHTLLTQSYGVSVPGEVIPGRGSQYSGVGFELDLGPVVLHPIAHVHAHFDAQDGYRAEEINASVVCR